MATKKGKRSTSVKKSAEAETIKKKSTKKEVEASVEDDAAEVVEEVVEVVEVVESTNDDSSDVAGGDKVALADKLIALNPVALVAEAIGMFVISIVCYRLIDNTAYGLLAIALVISVMSAIFFKVSGSHFNPAITVAQWILRKINGVKATAYILAQILGVAVAMLAIHIVDNQTVNIVDEVKNKLISATKTAQEPITVEKLAPMNKQQLGEYLKSEYSMTFDEAVSQLGIKTSSEVKGKLSNTKEKEIQLAQKTIQPHVILGFKTSPVGYIFAELIGSIIVGAGAAFAYARRKTATASGAATVMGGAYITGLIVAGSTAILNPALGIIYRVYDLVKGGSLIGFSGGALAASILVYIVTPIIGTTLGFLIYSQCTKDANKNAESIEV